MPQFRKGSIPEVDRKLYGDVRPLIKEGDILLWRGNYLVSKIFRRAWGSHYSHVAIVAKWDRRIMVLQSVWPAIEAVPLSRTVADYDGRVDLYELRDPGSDPRWANKVLDVMTHAKGDLGLPYSIWDIFVNVLASLFRFTRRDRIHPTRMFCSQYVAHSFDNGDLDLVPDKEDVVTWPKDISKSVYLKRVGTLEPNPDAPSGAGFGEALRQSMPWSKVRHA